MARPARAAASDEIAPAAGGGEIDATGRFTTSIPIEVPRYRGLEPALALIYDSGTGNGFAGMGWSLRGQSFVERASPGRGVPRYDDSDVFLLDGQELVACTALGGTHCVRQQTYQRIRWDGPGDRWEVWERNGTKSTYTSVLTTSFGTFRWALASRTDTHGNTVTYSYWRAAPENAYLDAISYNGSVITLWREARPDPVTFTNGEYVGTTNYRLKTIEVNTSGSRVRAYALSYAAAPSTGRSRLVSVRQYGRDAVLDASGTIIAGTALPPVTMAYTDGAARIGGQNRNNSIGGWDPSIRDLFADVNGDGKADLIRIWNNGDAWAQVTPSDGDGYPFEGTTFNASIGGWSPEFQYYAVDVTGDGRADLVTLWHCGDSTCAQVNPSDGYGFPSRSFNEPIGGWNPAEYKDYFADVDGDYRADFVRIWRNGDQAWAQVRPSNGSGFPADSFNEPVGGWQPEAHDNLADVNGDGKADLIRIWNNGDAWAQVTPSNGAGFPLAGTTFNASIGGWSTEFTDHFADLNGDGKADLIRVWNNGTAWAQVSLSTGKGYPTRSWNASIGGWDPANIGYAFADVSGDGRVDLLQFWRNGDQAFLQINPYDGVGFPNASFNEPVGGWDPAWKFYPVDVNADGKTDLVRIWNNGTAWAQVNLGIGPTPDLLTSLSNGIGGDIGVAYAPSSRWWSAGHALPAVFPTVATVSRGDGRGTSFTTAYSFADGAWARQPAERRFLGFGSSRAVVDDAGTYRETFYRQSLAAAGQPDRSYLKNSAGQVYEYEQWSYAESGAPPYTALVSSHARFECNLTASCRQARTDYSYDEYANVVTEANHRDVSVTGDEVTTAWTYAPNTSAYLVNLPATQTRHAGTSTSGAQLSRSGYFYDAASSSSTPPTKGDRTRLDDWNSISGGYVTTRSEYDQWGNAVSTTDARGSTSTSGFDPTYHVFAIRACDALSHCTDTAWDTVLGKPSTVTDPNGAVTRHDYDALGRQTARTDPAGQITTWQYLDLGNAGQQRVRETRPDGSADGLWADTYVDGLGRAWQTVKEGPTAGVMYVQDRVYRSTTTLVWKESLWRQSGQPVAYTVLDYDGADRLVRTTHPDGASATLSYGSGADGRPFVTAVDELGHAKTTVSNVDGRVTTVQERNGADSYTTSYGYDLLSRLTTWTDAAGNTSTVTYNSLGWKTAMTDMDTGASRYAYDDGGLLVRQTDAKNQTTTFGYDALGRRTTLTYPDGGQALWFYDETGHGAAIGRLTRVTYPAGSESHSWDARGLETSTTQCVDTACATIGRSYDSMGRLATLTYPDGEAVGHRYDAAGRLSSVGGYVTSMAWSPADRVAAISYGNGTQTAYSYDPNRQWLTSATVTGPGGGPLYRASYGYDAAGLVASMSQGTPATVDTTYRYDELRRLTSVSGSQSQSFSYDAIGNITSNSAIGTYRYGDAAHKHAVTAAGSASYTYDANGNMLSGDGRTFVWDNANRLASITQGGTTTAFAYDAGERRLKKTSGASVTRYFGEYAEQVNGSLVKYYYAGPILVARSAGGTKTWYHADRIGSTRLITDAAGAEVRDYDYQPYGDMSSTTGTAPNERTFTGHIRDAETGLMYMLARYQDPKLGRFISPDTVIPDPADPQNINRYSYARNNPVNNTDPTGHTAICENDWLCYDIPSVPSEEPPPPPPPPPECDVLPMCAPEPWSPRPPSGGGSPDLTRPAPQPRPGADYTVFETTRTFGGTIQVDYRYTVQVWELESTCLQLGRICVTRWSLQHREQVIEFHLRIPLEAGVVTGRAHNEHTKEWFDYAGLSFEKGAEPGVSVSTREGNLIKPAQPNGRQVSEFLTGTSVSYQTTMGATATAVAVSVPAGQAAVEHGIVALPGFSISTSITYGWRSGHLIW